MRVWAVLLGTALALAAAIQGAAAQERAGGFRSAILTIDPDILYQDSGYGQSIASALDAEFAALAAENRRIETELRDEELALTEQRAELAPADFRALAAAYDDKVQTVRREQDAKETELLGRREAQVQIFLNDIRPILARMMVEAGATVIVDRRSVFVSFNSIDITRDAIARIDATLLTDSGEPVQE